MQKGWSCSGAGWDAWQVCCYDSLFSGCGFQIYRSIEQEASLLTREEVKQIRRQETVTSVVSQKLMETVMKQLEAEGIESDWLDSLISGHNYYNICRYRSWTIEACFHFCNVAADLHFYPDSMITEKVQKDIPVRNVSVLAQSLCILMSFTQAVLFWLLDPAEDTLW